MNQNVLYNALETNGDHLVRFFDGLTQDEVRWKPDLEKWSLLEVLGHLLDEERDDFRTRIRLTLEEPNQDWPPIDPEGWARDRDYNSRDLQDSLTSFREERKASLRWLRGLSSPAWSTEKQHPKFPPLKAGDLLLSWVAHDLLHWRQLMNTRLAYLTEQGKPYSMDYASP